MEDETRLAGGKRAREAERVRLLEATVALVAERGYRSTSVEALSARAGVSREAFFELFCGREDCLLAALDAVVLRASVRVLDAWCAERCWRERMRAGLTALLAFLDEEPVLARFAVVEAFGATERAQRQRARVLAQLCEAVDAGRLEAPAGLTHSPLSAESVVRAVVTVIHESLLDGGDGRLVELAGPLMSLVVLPYLGEEAARGELEGTGLAWGVGGV